MQHPRAGEAASGYRDPTTLFVEKFSSTTTTLSDESDEDYRMPQGFVAPGSRTQAVSTQTGDPSHPMWSTPGIMRALTGSKHKNIDARVHAEWVQRQRDEQERRFLRKRRALDYEHSVVFVQAGPESRDGHRSRGANDAPPRRQRHGNTSNGVLLDDEPIDYVPAELKAWYVASRTAVRRASPVTHRRSKSAGATAQGKVHHSPRRDPSVELGDSPGGGGDTLATTGAQTSRPTIADLPNSSEDSVFGDVAVVGRQAISSGSAGTTSVNVLQSREAPRGSRGWPPASSAAVAADAAALYSSESCATPGSPREGDASGKAAANGREVAHGDSCDADRSLCADGKGEVNDRSAVEEAVTDSNNVVSHPWGGRPPLRAHRYVEQPNGVFIDHAHHADLLAEYAVAADLRHAQEKTDARLARRWTRLLYGPRGGQAARWGGGRRLKGTVATAASANGSGTAMSRFHKYGSHDPATYRQRFVTTLRYLQRLHVFLSAFAAGVSLLTLLAITVPFPDSHTGSGTSAVLLLALFADVSSTQTDTAAAHVFPVLEQGRPAFALFLTLLQGYNASLLLCLTLLMFITGYAPLPWGFAEQYWVTQRRRWLKQEHNDTEQPSDRGSETGLSHLTRGGGGHRRNSITSADGNGLPGNDSTRGLEYTRRLGSTAHQATMSCSDVLGGVTSNDGHLGETSASALFRTTCSPLSPDRRLSMSLGGGGGGRTNTAAYASYEPSYNESIGDSGLGSPLAGAHRRYSKGTHLYADSGLAGQGGRGTWDVAQRMPPSATTCMSPRGNGSSTGRAATGSPGYQQQQEQPHRLQETFTSRGARSVLMSSTAPDLEPTTPTAHRGGGGGGGGAGVNHPTLQPSSSSALFFSGNPLEGSLSANNAFTRAFDDSQRRVTKWLCSTLHVLAHTSCMFCARRGEGAAKSQRAGGARGGATWEVNVLATGHELASAWSPGIRHTEPVVHVSPYLYLLLKPRLWCVVAALVLTVAEIALVDERSIELLWLAQPASWGSAAAVPPPRRTSSGEVVLPHAWTVANFTSTPLRMSGGGGGRRPAAVPDASILSEEPLQVDAEGTPGHLWRVLTAIYATRMAVLWLTFLLNLFL
ncbi:hypothetical protein JKF63_07767 [Porcisia hertigi]|uniref:Uncharacterized protein n=1 Tax=Porcisia hertigi TaxID=2761500 RepID=A0A836LLU3_9TRYP|nr:hypothetical protein JKF63_07767 [Porcisia hertigi]